MSKKLMSKDVIENVISELGAGTLETQLAEALKEVGAKTAEHGRHGKEGKIIITMKFLPVKDGEQINIESTLFKEVPTVTAHKTEKYKAVTPFYVDKNMELNVLVPDENEGGQLNIV